MSNPPLGNDEPQIRCNYCGCNIKSPYPTNLRRPKCNNFVIPIASTSIKNSAIAKRGQKLDNRDIIYSKVKCENCGYVFVAPYPDDYICIHCNCFSANLFEYINGRSNFFREVESRDFEIQPSRNIEEQ